MFEAGMRTALTQRLVSIVLSVSDQTCFNRLATHVNISMFGHQTMFDGVWSPNIYRLSRPFRQTINVWRPNAIKHCLVTKHSTVWTSCLVLFNRVCMCLIVFDRVWSCLIKFERHQTFKQQLKTFLLFACLMGDVLFVWTAAYQTCLMRACVPRLLSGLYKLFHLCLIKHVLTVWPLMSTLACLVIKQCLMVFGRQTFIVCPGPYSCT